MKRTMFIVALVLFSLTQPAASADSRIARFCGPDHDNDVASEDDVRPYPTGYDVVSLSEQVSEGDPRIFLTDGDEFYLCTRSAATPDMEATKALLLMHERTVKYLFVPVLRRGIRSSS